MWHRHTASIVIIIIIFIDIYTCFTLSYTGSMWQIESHTSLGWWCTSACIGLSAWAVYTGRSSCWTTASSFRQPPSTRCSTVSARYVRPLHLRCRWTNDMELVPKTISVSRTCKLTVFVVHWRRFFLNSTRHIERMRGIIFATMRYINCHLHYITFTTSHLRCGQVEVRSRLSLCFLHWICFIY